MKSNKFDKLAWAVVKFKARYNRGNSWMNEVKDVMMTIISIYAAKNLQLLEIFGLDSEAVLTPNGVVMIGVGMLFVGYLIGWADEIKLLLWQRENIYGSRTVNPVFCEIEKSIAELHEKIDKMETKK